MRDGEDVILTVQDQGIGIAVEDQERIFKRFERAVSQDHFGGMGLGLYIVSQILQLHDGKIEVEGELGRGALFRVRIPVKGPPRPSADAPEPPERIHQIESASRP